MIRDWYQRAEGNRPVITITVNGNIVSGEVLLVVADKNIFEFHLGTKIDIFMKEKKKLI